jgi:hypothetical protein
VTAPGGHRIAVVAGSYPVAVCPRLAARRASAAGDADVLLLASSCLVAGMSRLDPPESPDEIDVAEALVRAVDCLLPEAGQRERRQRTAEATGALLDHLARVRLVEVGEPVRMMRDWLALRDPHQVIADLQTTALCLRVTAERYHAARGRMPGEPGQH